MAKRKLSDTTVQTALKAIEATIGNTEGKGLPIDETQALFDARRELSAMAAPATARAAAGRPKGSKNTKPTAEAPPAQA